MLIARLFFSGLLAGSLVYCVLTVLAARRYLAVRPPELRHPVPISVLKPLSGIDEGLEENLRSFFVQDYEEFELLFAVREKDDLSVAVVHKLMKEFPEVPARLIVTGEPPYPNAKVFSLAQMLTEARYDLLVISDSDVRLTPRMLPSVAAEFQDHRVELVTCPYRAVPGPSIWSTLEAIGMNTEFLGGVLVARLVEGMKFALGPTMALSRKVLDSLGGFDRFGEWLAEDFVMGKLVADRGYDVILSSYVIEHRIGNPNFGDNLKHRLRWARSTRRSRPRGYPAQIFTYPLPLALLVWALRPDWWPLLILASLFRAAAVWAVAEHVLHDPLTRKRWWLVPVQDVTSFALWLGGFFGNTISWRGRRYYVLPDGRLKTV